MGKSSHYTVEGLPIRSWDEYFYEVAKVVARNSKCLSRRIGAVLEYDKSIVAGGYNGPPRGVPVCDQRWTLDKEFNKKYGGSLKDGVDLTGKCPRKVLGFESGEGLAVCVAGHAERNTLINAARSGVRTDGTTMYMTCGIPCSPCLVEIINAGVKEIVVTSFVTYDESSMYLLEQSGLKYRLYDFIKEK